MRVVWTKHAIEQLAAIYDHIACDSPSYALGMIDRITARSTQIGAYPNSGGQVAEYGLEAVREVVESPYRVVYQIENIKSKSLRWCMVLSVFPRRHQYDLDGWIGSSSEGACACPT